MKLIASLPHLLAGLLLSFPSPAPSAEPEHPPRYQLQVGQQLVYQGSSQFKYENGSHTTTDQTTFWVTGQNDNGSWHLLAYNSNTFSQTFGDPPTNRPARVTEAFTAFDLFPNGRVPNLPEDYLEKQLPSLFTQFPDDLAQLRAGWEVPQEAGDTFLYRLAPKNDPASGQWLFEKTDQTLFNEIYLTASKALIHFDAGRGLITRIESEFSQGYSLNGKGTGLIELKSVSHPEPAWLQQLAQEAAALEEAKNLLRRAYESIRKGKNLSQAVAIAETALDRGSSQVKLPILVQQLEKQRENLRRSANYYAQERKQEEEVLDKPAADWTTTNLDGKECALTDYRGKVVVLDFWYRGCGWCIKAMPQIKEIVDHYQGKPVVVLGMNTDRDEKDARFVVNKLKLNYDTIKAQGLPEKYAVHGFPTLVIIDQKGIVRERHVGYSPDLRKTLIGKIDALLANRP